MPVHGSYAATFAPDAIKPLTAKDGTAHMPSAPRPPRDRTAESGTEAPRTSSVPPEARDRPRPPTGDRGLNHPATHRRSGTCATASSGIFADRMPQREKIVLHPGRSFFSAQTKKNRLHNVGGSMHSGCCVLRCTASTWSGRRKVPDPLFARLPCRDDFEQEKQHF